MGDDKLVKYAPKTPQKKGVNRQLPKRQNLYIAISEEIVIRRTSDLSYLRSENSNVFGKGTRSNICYFGHSNPLLID